MLRVGQNSALWRRFVNNEIYWKRNIVACFGTKSEANAVSRDEETFELLPPGCSMVDPAYVGEQDSEDRKIYHYDKSPETGEIASEGAGQESKPPANLAAAEERLKGKKAKNEDDIYVYLPPGCSVADPTYNSVTDPQESRRVYRRDPNPSP